jgi:hypothetical protein
MMVTREKWQPPRYQTAITNETNKPYRVSELNYKDENGAKK